ncbi:hypothetical protein M427DRAFT_95779 [Gonapodya prolifera JEL478]|uniref:DNA-(apurinic or apyrimidinic site) endonuclease n=1 Tax=Gonapodya prolifera (strain JEL478) TaxID=1344416 RepID=A0A139AQQ5_GONPJ|nr:hypothetical protein M427DRAFT_95779 [Gonapodya prolifera JEL478]|eukprot:KXS19058.1 hypothetical protein M427DRAFT_95779 [Gonapodya prolifera JEL478]
MDDVTGTGDSVAQAHPELVDGADAAQVEVSAAISPAKKKTAKAPSSKKRAKKDQETSPADAKTAADVIDPTAKDSTDVKDAEKPEKPDHNYPVNTAMPTSYDFLPPKAEKSVRIVSLNVAGIQAARKKGLDTYIRAESADILCLQETKLQAQDDAVFADVYPWRYWSLSKTKKGYSGTCVLSKLPPLSTRLGIPTTTTTTPAPTEDEDDEGRAVTLEFESFYLVANYVPNAGQKLERLAHKRDYAGWVREYLASLQTTKPVIWTGDLNVAHTAVDLTRPKGNTRTAGFTVEEREDFSTTLTQLDLVDLWRHLHPTEQDYTYYSYRFNCRAKHLGWRLDYFVVSRALLDKVRSCEIRNKVYGCSDHVPLALEIEV